MPINYDKIIEDVGKGELPVIGFLAALAKCKETSSKEFVCYWIADRHHDFLRSCGLETMSIDYFDAHARRSNMSLVKFIEQEKESP